MFEKGYIPWNKGLKCPYISIFNKGRKLSEETKLKISEIAKQKGFGKWMKGKKLTDEHKKNIGIASGKRKYGEKFKEKMRIITKGRFLGKKQSLETRLKRSEATKGTRTGKSNPNWNGGITNETAKIRTSIENRLWRESVFARDNWTCQKTGIKGERLAAHHIKNFSLYPELRFAIDNGITLSKETHDEFHRIYGKKNNTIEQIIEFMGGQNATRV
jgi:hypothetical protein